MSRTNQFVGERVVALLVWALPLNTCFARLVCVDQVLQGCKSCDSESDETDVYGGTLMVAASCGCHIVPHAQSEDA